jgi:hypothetical protein
MADSQSTALKFNIPFFWQGVLLFWEMRHFHMRMDNVYSHFRNNGHV